ncbi:unnamed protein product, partial [Mesorhabditis belari]|uniref:E3 ubiquitin-protein ligase n=1 Tax=Mesorhabditis belari TaxID=2138241 RepID=A0AAF3J7Z8_9BILA
MMVAGLSTTLTTRPLEANSRMDLSTGLRTRSGSSSEETETLRVRIVRGEKLGGRDLFGVTSPYVIVSVETAGGELIHKVQLETKKKTRNPQWHERVTFRCTRNSWLKVHVYSENKIRKDQFLGKVELDLSSPLIPNDCRPAGAYALKGGKHRNAGIIHMSVHFSSGDHSPSTSSADAPTTPSMPEGWEEREDANGRTFYVNHLLRTTQWDRPSLEDNSDSIRDIENRQVARSNYNQRMGVDSSPQAVHNDLVALDERMSANFHGTPNGNGDDEDGSLPAGWDMQVASNGRIFYVDHNTKTTQWDHPRTGFIRSVGKTDDELGPLPEGWEQRVHTDGRVFFIDHNSKQTQWDDPRFENESIAGPAIPYSRDFKRKVEYLRQKLPRATSNGKCDLIIHRDSIFEDSYRQIMDKSVSELRHKLWIEFAGETGLDYGGVAREWCFLLSHEIFNPYYGLFEYSATDNYTLQINPHSETANPEHLNYYHFIGRVIGMAIYHGKLLDAFFIRPFYKMMLGKKITLFDMESVDNAYYNSLIFVMDNDPSDLDLTFSVDDQVYGETQTVELIENGRNVGVTEENKKEYIEAVVNWRFIKRIEPQMGEIMKGVNEIVPSNLLKLFDANELELLMCGLQKIDVKDWKGNTIYKGGYGPSSQVIHNFWKCILSFDNEMRARVLQFVTGTSRVPMNGFRELYGSNGPQKFTIERWGSPDMLPRSHTCFNRLDLPPYQTFNELKQKLCTAIENSEIFSGVD